MHRHNMEKWPILNLLRPKFMSTVHIAVVFSNGELDDNALIVTDNDMVYAIGTNSNGCLGTGDTKSTFDPIEVKGLSGKGIKTFACGKDYVLALTKTGLVYAWGNKIINQTPYSHYSYEPDHYVYYSYEVYGCTPTLLHNNLSKKFIVNISCGSNHSLALTNKGELYACQSVSNSGRYFTQVACVLNSNYTSIACGNGFSMALTNKGEVYGWGQNNVGQLGVGDYSDWSVPSKTALNDVIVKVVCGYTHTLALSAKGHLYVWGENSYGQLGCGIKGNVCSPVKVKEMDKVQDIAASYRSHISVAEIDGGIVYIWGQCQGQSIMVPTITSLKCLDDAFIYYAWPRVTYQPLIFYNGKSSNLKSSLSKAFNDPTTSDFIIEVQGRSIYVHKAVLKIRCQHFRTMFQKDWVENCKRLQLEKYSYDAYESFLKYLYTDEIDVSSEDVLVELLDIANMYFACQLKSRCIQMLVQKFTVKNIAYLYSISVKYNSKKLETYCFNFALKHMTAVVQTLDFVELDKSILRSFLIKAAQAGAFKT